MSLIVGDRPPIFEELSFYNDTIHIRYDDVAHVYYRCDDNKLIPLDGVTTVVKIIDKSEALMNWSCNMMGEKLLASVPTYIAKNERQIVSRMPMAEFQVLIHEAKRAHKEKLEDAANVGKEAHKFIEAFIKMELGLVDRPTPPTEERALNCVHAALAWMDAHNVQWLETERKVMSREFEFSGTMDGLAICSSCDNPRCCPTPFENELSLVDWKSANALHLQFCLQTAAYGHALCEEFPEKKILHRFLIKLGKEDGHFASWHLGAETQDQDFQAFLTCLDLVRCMRALKERMDAVADAQKEYERAEKRAAKEAASRIKCPKFDKYKGSRRSVCLADGSMCQACETKFNERQATRLATEVTCKQSPPQENFPKEQQHA
jgi:hypothetical protein